MFNNVEQRENLGMALIASSRVESYAEDDDIKAMAHVREVADAATLGRVNDMLGDANDDQSSKPPSHEANDDADHAANGAANGAANHAGNGAAANGAAAPSQNGRDRRGRFALGNRGGVGNPFARQVAALRAEFINGCSRDDLREIRQKFVAMAKQGDHAAAKLVLSYTLGKPLPIVDPDR